MVELIPEICRKDWLAICLQIVTREARIDDLETLYRIEFECFDHEAFAKDQLAYFLRTSRFVSLVAEVNRDIAGFIIGSVEHYKNRIYGRVVSLDVSEKYRRRGVASKLLDEVEKIFVRNGAGTCYLEVRTDNAAALQLYKGRGYMATDILKNYYKTGINGFRLKKDLST